ncbi:DUF6928 family protein [Kitasatospora sp. NPDC004614]|uniref:DUF6928 family protein n=1 Tax=unclassified Kitasatospora TaxID=2633591 RepID=UPI00369F9461
MGAKTALLAYAEAAIADVLQDAPAPDLDQAATLLARIRPGHRLDAGNDEPWALAEALYPPEGTVCALSVPGLDLICDPRQDRRPGLSPYAKADADPTRQPAPRVQPARSTTSRFARLHARRARSRPSPPIVVNQ